MKEKQLDFAHSYISSAIQITRQYFRKTKPFKSTLDFKKSYVLCGHFLMAHGVELYLKFLIMQLKGTPTIEHGLIKIVTQAETLLKKYYNITIFNKEEEIFIKYLDRNMKFRYPTDKHWKVIPEIFKEANSWNEIMIKNFIKNCNNIRKKLNDWGYEIECNKKIK